MRQPSDHLSGHLNADAMPRARLVRRVLAASIVAAFGHQSALAQESVLPTGMQIANGTAHQAFDGSRMTVTNSRNAVLDWQSFSIGAGNGVHFQQEDTASKVLNRVVGNDPSRILGSLSSNGEVWLVNPNGVLFGADARIDVGALVASTLGVRNEDFLAGRRRFGGDGAPGAALENGGDIFTSFGGRVWLVGGAVRNEGAITAPGGQIVLAAGQSIELVDSGMPNVTVRVSAPDDAAVNLGRLLAPDSGSIDLHGAIVNQSGIVRADSIDGASAGRVVIRGRSDVQLARGSTTSANADMGGGQVSIEAIDGAVSIEGQVAAAGGAGSGGSIEVRAGGNVVADGAASFDASGVNGGGAVLVSGANVHIGASTTLRANAEEAGDGGTIVVRADADARVYGSLDASGGFYGGTGGRIETSGRTLDADPRSVDAGGEDSGSWLVKAGSLRVTDSRKWEEAGDPRPAPSLVSNTALDSALSNGTQVRLVADSQGLRRQDANIVVGGHIQPRPGEPGAALALEARNDVVLEPGATIVPNGATMRVTLTAGSDGSGVGAIELGSGSRIHSGGANVELRAPTIALHGATINANDEGRPGTDLGQISIAGNDVTLQNTRVNADGAIRIDGATSIGLDLANLNSQARGDSIVLSTASIRANASGLTTPDGRWLVYLDRIGDAFSPQYLGDLGYTFVQIGADKTSTRPATLPQQHGVIVREDLDVRIHVDADRPYNGGTLATITGSRSSDLPSGLELQASQFTHESNFFDKHAGSGKPIDYQGDGPLFGIVVTPYRDTGTGARPVPVFGARQTYVADIERLPVSATQVAAQDKVYDGNRNAILSGIVSGVLPGDSATLDGALGRFDSRHAGTAKTVTVDGASLAGPDGANYVVSNPDLQASITPLALGTGGLSVLDKVYDGSRSATLADTLQGVLRGDDVRVGAASALFEDKNAGTGKAVAITGAFLAGADAGNYLLDDAVTAHATIAPRRIAASAMTARDKVYDGTRNATVNGTLAGLVEGDNVRLDSSGLFDDRNAGANKTVYVSDARLTGADAGNYLFSAPATLRASITARTVSAGALVVQDKVYDGTRNANVSGTLVGLVAGDSVRLEGARGLFADKNAGAAKTVTLSGGALAGADARNYSLAGGAATGVASITPRAIDVSGVTAQDKVYDGAREATLSGTLTGILADDQVSLDSASGLFADKNAGVGKVVTFNGVTLGGADARNYTVNAPGAVRATITPRQLALTGLAAQDKVYDGTRDAQVSATLAGAVAGDAVTFDATGLFDTKHAGSGKTVQITGTLRGVDAANYALPVPTGISASAVIEHRALEIVIDGAPRKEYDATTAVALAPGAFSLNGVVAGDTLAVRGPAQGRFDSRDAGSGKQVLASGVFEILGADAANYRVGATTLGGASNRVDATAVGSGGTITPATLVYNARPGAVIGALDIDGLRGTVTGFKGDDTLANATSGTLQWSTTATPVSGPGRQPVLGSGLRAANYVLVQNPGNATALDIRAGLPAGGPLQRAQDSGVQAITHALQEMLPALPALEAGVAAGALFDRSSPAAAQSFGPVDLGAMSQH